MTAVRCRKYGCWHHGCYLMQIQAMLHHRVCSTHDTCNGAVTAVVTLQYSSLTKQPSTAAGQGDTCHMVHCIAEKSVVLPVL